MTHQRNTSGLTPFKPGQSGNPAGRPKGSSLKARLERILSEDDGKVAEALAKAGVQAALKGDYRFWAEILNRIDGPVKAETPDEVIVRIIQEEQP
jgi:hypothetical protein